MRVVFGLDIDLVKDHNHKIIHGDSIESGRPPILDFIDPLSDENPRLVSQGALFTRGPIGTPVERWISQAFAGTDARVLFRLEIPDADRLICLRTLERMNINHLSLFPDLSGASAATNLRTELRLKS